MGRRGPQPKPTPLKLLRGNPGKRKLNKAEPRVRPEAPPMPPDLCDLAVEAWERLVPQLAELRIIGRIDADALRLWCETWALWRRARDLIEEQGFTTSYTDVDGTERITARPEVNMERRYYRDLLTFGRDFGLTPSSRSGLKVAGDEEVDPLEALLGSG